MRCESGETESGCVLFHYVPDYPFCYAVTPVFAGSTDTSEQSSGRDFSCSNPQVDRRFGPVGHRYGSNVPAFAEATDQKSTRHNTSHLERPYAVFCFYNRLGPNDRSEEHTSE